MRLTRLCILGVLAAGLLVLGLVSIALAADPSVTITSYAYVGPPLLVVSPATNVTISSATLNGEIIYRGGSNVTCRGFEWGYGSGNYTLSWNETGAFEEGPFSYDVGNLTGNVYVYWRAFAISDRGQGNSTELRFFTTALPDAPTDFIVTTESDTVITISWTMGNSADTIIIRGSSSKYPPSVTDGYLVYSGNETALTITGLSLMTSTYYYRAWSHNDYGYSLMYAQGQAGDPIGIPSIIFLVSMCGFAIWKKDWLRMLLSACVIMWGVFAIQYDIKIAAPLLALGTILFTISLVKRIESTREEQT